MKKIINLLLASLIISLLGVSAVSAAGSLFDDGWRQQIGKKSELQAFDKDCPKGMIMGRFSKGYFDCTWAGSNSKRSNAMKVVSSTSNDNNDDVDDVVECGVLTETIKKTRSCEVVCEKKFKNHCIDYELECTNYVDVKQDFNVCSDESLVCYEYKVTDKDYFQFFGWKDVEKSRDCQIVKDIS